MQSCVGHGFCLWLLVTSAACGQDGVTFNRDVRALLSDRCFVCHGPDGSKRQAELRLDVRDVALGSGAIVPGKPDESELIRRILSTDPEEHMPPAAAKLGDLTPSEIRTLGEWIAQGAIYEDHWAFIPLSRDLLQPDDDATARIDQLVEGRIASRGLKQQPEADRQTLIRRLTFDLTGLPPTVAEVTDFVADESPAAYDTLTDRLLSSPQFGERMAVDWLDVARYADSYGFQVDREREMWPWRDWVVRAFNENLPFDQFLTWQIAGDLLPGATDDQILATAFSRLHQQESEGGSVEEEYRVEYVCDRVQTTATAFLGLTFECARCHDHKYDPVRQAEYYQMFAMFQNIDEAGLYSYFTMSPPTPTLQLTDAGSRTQLELLQSRVAELEQHTVSLRADRRAAFGEWLRTAPVRRAVGTADPGTTDRGTADPGTALPLPESARYEFDELEETRLRNSIAPDQPAVLRGENRLVAGRTGMAVQFTGDDPVDLPLGNFRREEPFSISLWLMTPDEKDRAVVFHRSRAWTDAASRGYELLIENGRLKWSLIHFWPGNAASVAVREKLPTGQWVHVTVTSDGSSRAAGLRILVDGRPVALEVVRDHLTREITGGGGDNIALGERFRDRGFRGGTIDDFRVFSRELTLLEALAAFDSDAARALLTNPEELLTAAERELLQDYYLASSDVVWSQHLAALQTARSELGKHVDGLREIMVMRELPQPKAAWVLFRGEYSERREEVQAGVPEWLLPLPADVPRNRLGLARWLTDPNHPLTARVTVNRIWQSLFGRGLVKTSEDFGSQGSRPLYPEVLDTLAVQLQRSGWDVKDLLRTIVRSRTYRQRSLADETTMVDDPENEWLARGPSFRLPAEMIRDNALMAAGLLSLSPGGPPVNPYEMEEAFKPAAASAGDGVYRRSLYTNWRRTGPPPAMLAFDAPRRAVCIAKRERTDSPLQALILLNGIQYVEAARVLGERVYRETNGNLPAMIELACLKCLSRKPDAREAAILSQLYQEQREHFENHPAETSQLLAVGRAPRDVSIPEPLAAAAAMLAQTLLNHDACVVKR